MAGHSKWANVQHRKNRQDAKRGKIFTRLIKEITVAARLGGGDADSNPRLRLAVDKAYAHNMPKDNVERAIKKASGEDTESYEAIRYEGYGPGGVAVIAVRNCGHVGRVGHWAELLVAAGLVSLHFVNTSGLGLLVAPVGGINRRLSANPVAAFFP